jgi:hypothetical protein
MSSNNNTPTNPHEWQHDEDVRAALEAFLTERQMTQSEFSRRINVTPSRVNKYLRLNQPAAGDTPRKAESDMPTVEASAKRFLRHISRREAFHQTLFATSVSRQVDTVLKTVRRTGDIGLVHGPAGIGKSCGAELFCGENHNTIFITVSEYANSAGAVETAIFEEFTAASEEQWPGNVRRMVWLEKILRGSERLIIVDNAHQLTTGAFRLLFNFHDTTGVPIGLIGNPEVLRLIRANDQLFSRIGFVSAVRVRDDSEAIARQMITQYFRGAEDEILESAANIVTRFGHARTLKKQLALAADIYAARPADGRAKAFEAAATRLIKSL